MVDKEIEIQVQVDNIKPLLDFLKTDARFQARHHQIDEYFTPSHRNFLGVRPAVEWLRLRDSNGAFFVTYKKSNVDFARYLTSYLFSSKKSYCVKYSLRLKDGKKRDMQTYCCTIRLIFI